LAIDVYSEVFVLDGEGMCANPSSPKPLMSAWTYRAERR
jgi:hypothetical protein